MPEYAEFDERVSLDIRRAIRRDDSTVSAVRSTAKKRQGLVSVPVLRFRPTPGVRR